MAPADLPVARKAKKPQASPRQRVRQFCAEMDEFPSEEMLAYLTDVEGISHMRFCSLQSDPGRGPQLLKHSQQWQGGVMIFFRHASYNGLDKNSWERITNCLLMRPRYFELRRDSHKILWKTFLESLATGDCRVDELRDNIICTKVGPKLITGPMSPTAATAAAREQEEALAAATEQAVQACEEAEAAAAAAVEQSTLTEEDRLIIKRLSLQATLNYVAKRCEQESVECLAGQPCRKRAKAAHRSLKSKKPEHVAAAKAKEEARARRLHPGKADKAGKQVTFADQAKQTPSLSLAQKVVHRSLPQPEGLEWKYEVAVFLQSREPFSRSRGKGRYAVSVFRSLLPQSCAIATYFHMRNKAGLGAIYPCAEKAQSAQERSPPPSTLELHRCALRVEGTAERLLRACAAALSPAAAASLDPRDAADLQAAWRRRGGITGGGPAYWPAGLDAGLFPLGKAPDGELAACLEALRAGRAAAFRREYLIVDEVAWCMPYLAKIFFLRSRVQSPSPVELKGAFEDLTKFRLCAIRADAAPLVAYARGALHYAWRLAQIGSALGLADETEEARAELEAAAATLSRAPRDDGDAAVVRCRNEDEARETRSILRDLGLQSSPALEQAERLRAAIAAAMQADSHQSQATQHLHPSPSLPGAAYEPRKYLEGQGTEEHALGVED